MLLKKYNIEEMQKQGFKLTAEDIYNINQASLKDAVIGLGREESPFFIFAPGRLQQRRVGRYKSPLLIRHDSIP